MKKKHKVFVAVNLPEDIKRELYLYQRKWPELSRPLGGYESAAKSVLAKWVAQDNLHITLVFLGYLSDLQVGETCLVLKETLQKYNSFELKLNKITYGPAGKLQPRMIWVEGERNKQLSLIKKDLEVSLLDKMNYPGAERQGIPARLTDRRGEFLRREDMIPAPTAVGAGYSFATNFVPEKRAFNPHITLARLNAFEWRAIEPEERPEINENIELPFTVESIELMESVLKRTGPVYTILESFSLKT